MNTNTIITDENDIYIFFELVSQLQPASILDVGIFLQRIGAVSRQTMSCEIPPDIYMEGLEVFGQPVLPVYHKIYDKITRLPDYSFFENAVFDLAFFLHVNEFIHPDDRLFFWQYITTHARTIIADTSDAAFVNYAVTHCSAEAVNVEGQQYAVIYGNIQQS